MSCDICMERQSAVRRILITALNPLLSAGVRLTAEESEVRAYTAVFCHVLMGGQWSQFSDKKYAVIVRKHGSMRIHQI